MFTKENLCYYRLLPQWKTFSRMSEVFLSSHICKLFNILYLKYCLGKQLHIIIFKMYEFIWLKKTKEHAYRNLGSRLWGSILMTKQSGLLGCTSQIKLRTQHSTDILPPQTTTYREKREIILLFLLNSEIPFIFIFTLEPWLLIWKVHQTVLGICK